MTDAGAPGPYRARPGSPIEDAALATRVAGRLAAAPASLAVLMEWRSASPGVLLVPADGPSARLIADTVPGDRSGSGDGRPPGPPPRWGATRFATVVGFPRIDGKFRPGPEGEESVADPAEGRPGGRWGVQLHLAAVGRPDRLDASLRLAVDAEADGAAGHEADLVARLAGALALDGLDAEGRRYADRPRFRREWYEGALRSFRSVPSLALSVRAIGRLAELLAVSPSGGGRDGRHVVLFGSSGSGKTTQLAEAAARSIRDGAAIFALDVHGDLAPAVLSRLGAAERGRVVAIDVEAPEGPGIDVLADPGAGAAPRIVAALRRASDDAGERYWGFRLERIFDEFVRIALDAGGDLPDLYELLTDPRRRAAAREATEDPARQRFLDEVEAIVRRSPEFLWPAASRISKVLLVPELRRLLAPGEAGVEVDRLLADGRSILVRLPIGRIGPEAASLGATLLLARVYLGRTGRRPTGAPPLVIVLDEVQSVAPALVAEILAEGRKFGIVLWLATQYPGRLAGPLRDAASASAGSPRVLRTPAAAVPEVAPWLGLPRDVAGPLLPRLPAGAYVHRDGPDGRPTLALPPDPAAPEVPGTWEAAVRSTAVEFPNSPDPAGPPGDERGEALFRVRARELGSPEEGGDVAPDRLRRLVAAGWIVPDDNGTAHVTSAGRAYLGEIGPTGATREGAVHRGLLAEAYRLFARNGERLEIVRQGGFDRRLPDGRLLLLTEAERRASPATIARLLATRRDRWAYRAFGGRDVFVEAEVSGAEHRDRLRRDLAKARAAGAHCLFLVPDARRAATVRGVVRAQRGSPVPATVWVLRPGGPEGEGRPRGAGAIGP